MENSQHCSQSDTQFYTFNNNVSRKEVKLEGTYLLRDSLPLLSMKNYNYCYHDNQGRLTMTEVHSIHALTDMWKGYHAQWRPRLFWFFFPWSYVIAWASWDLRLRVGSAGDFILSLTAEGSETKHSPFWLHKPQKINKYILKKLKKST